MSLWKTQTAIGPLFIFSSLFGFPFHRRDLVSLWILLPLLTFSSTLVASSSSVMNPLSRLGFKNGITTAHSHQSYDYTMSTEWNHSVPKENATFVGKYASYRKKLDYNYHSYYSEERQLLHDHLIDSLSHTVVCEGDAVCETPLENWLVFTAGPMGAGKGHTIEWLHQHGLFPLNAFVKVDPDALRELLPELREYCRIDRDTAGALTQKEVGYICEVLTMLSLDEGKNILVDGSLRDASWYQQYILNLRRRYSMLKIAILQISASESVVMERARKRELITGRHVPEQIIRESIAQVPKSIEILAPLVNFVAMFENDDDLKPPRLVCASNRVSTNDEIRKHESSDREECPLNYTRNWTTWFKDIWIMNCPIPGVMHK